MFRKSYSLALCAAVIGLSVGACSKKNLAVAKKDLGPSKKIAIEASVVRTLVTNELKLSNSFADGVRELGLYTPDNCFQYVRHTKAGVVVGDYLELSASTCDSTAPQAEDKVLARFPVKQHPQYFTQFRISYFDASNPDFKPEIGMIRKLTDNGVESLTLEALCEVKTIWTDEGFDYYCNIALDNSFFRTPGPLQMCIPNP